MAKKYTLEKQGIKGVKKVYWDLSVEELYEQSLSRKESQKAKDGPLVVETGKYTGRSPNDKFTVKEPSSEKEIWWGKVNCPITAEKFDGIHKKVLNYVKGKELFVQDCYVGADPDYAVPIRVITQYAWHSIFVRNMFLTVKDPKKLAEHVPEYTVISLPGCHAEPSKDGTNSEAFILPNFGKKLILIGGTRYAGEIKKSVFTLLNYVLPQKGILSMHCSANVGKKGDSAVFFGLSGTGKTTLSADPKRRLIGDDEHGWSDKGIFNFEGGCYAKMIRLSPTAEPEIYSTTKKFGTILENVILDPKTGKIDLNDDSKTENTRGSYPLNFIPNSVLEGVADHPKNIIMLTCGAFGIFPPIVKLTPAQAMYHFISGYTAKVAGTERGIKEPQATFSACFGAPFMALHPGVYAKLLGEKISRHGVDCWLVNTGWIGGPYGVGHRIDISDSRAVINAALSGELAKVPMQKDPVFGFEAPKSCPGISSQDILNPRGAWKDPKAYDQKAKELAASFHANFEKYADEAPKEAHTAGPVV